MLEGKIKEIDLFAGLSAQELAQLRGYLQPFSATAGSRLISQATSYQGLHIILSGSVQVQLKVFGGGELDIALLKAGDIFGEASLIANYTATSSVIAVETVTGLLLTPSSLQTVAIIYPQLSDKIKQAIALRCCQRSRQLLHHIPNKAEYQQVWPMPKLVKKEALKKAVDNLNSHSLSEFLKTPNAQPLPIPFFSTLAKNEIDFLNSLVKLRVLYRGEVVQNTQENNPCFYWLLWGAVQAVTLSVHMIKVATYGPGEFFGTTEYVDKLTQPYRYVMREDGIYFSLDEAAMTVIKEKMPVLWDKIMQSLWASVGAQMAEINWIFLQLNVEDVYKMGQGVSHV
jgi:CRP-like cAMP-binding protein